MARGNAPLLTLGTLMRNYFVGPVKSLTSFIRNGCRTLLRNYFVGPVKILTPFIRKGCRSLERWKMKLNLISLEFISIT
jgi:hypothetical protein